MESPVPSTESLPALYRAILDLVADLEHRGLRRDAIRIRAEATEVYSTSWDDRGHRRLHQVHERAWRIVREHDDPSQARPSAWRRSGAPARAASR
ncbi:MAG TPA: hypothetical protein VFS32_01515 [Candidatus Limnocylindrales bacterium]|nr:hypothetical protein [Candidatus Limnocylindrales bacterium]